MGGWEGLLALLAVLAACSDRYGAYFVVDGHGEIEFDRVEFYFGENAGEGPRPAGPRDRRARAWPARSAARRGQRRRDRSASRLR